MYEEYGPTYRPASVLVGLLTIGFILYATVAFVGVGSTWMEIGLLNDAQAGMEITESAAAANDMRQGLVGLAQVAITLFTTVLFCCWIYRANKNARALGAEGMSFTPGWCVGWFFIPVMNLFKPYQAVDEIWRASDPQADSQSWAMSSKSGLITGWWWMWIISGLCGQAAMRLSWGAEALPDMMTASVAMMGSYGVDMVLGILAMLVVRSIYDRQDDKFHTTPPPQQQSFDDGPSMPNMPNEMAA